MMLLWAHEEVDLEVGLVHLEQVEHDHQEDQVSMPTSIVHNEKGA
jgi:hypothetical protein